ncbi:hypothetical protein Tco_0228578 [Tanacetum coccineum]
MYIMTPRPRTRVFCPGPVWGCDSKDYLIIFFSLFELRTEKREVSRSWIWACIYLLLLGFSGDVYPIVTPDVGAVSVVSPSRVLDLVDYSPSSDSDPSEDSLPPVPYLPLVL